MGPQYHDLLKVFDQNKTDELLSHKPYDHKIVYTERKNVNSFQSKIYPMYDYKYQKCDGLNPYGGWFGGCSGGRLDFG